MNTRYSYNASKPLQSHKSSTRSFHQPPPGHSKTPTPMRHPALHGGTHLCLLSRQSLKGGHLRCIFRIWPPAKRGHPTSSPSVPGNPSRQLQFRRCQSVVIVVMPRSFLLRHSGVVKSRPQPWTLLPWFARLQLPHAQAPLPYFATRPTVRQASRRAPAPAPRPPASPASRPWRAPRAA